VPKKIVSLSESWLSKYRVLEQVSNELEADFNVVFRFDKSSGLGDQEEEPTGKRGEKARRRIYAFLESARAISLEEFLRAGQLRTGYVYVIGERIEEDEFETVEIDSTDVFGDL
jgi:hypothetical protein